MYIYIYIYINDLLLVAKGAIALAFALDAVSAAKRGGPAHYAFHGFTPLMSHACMPTDVRHLHGAALIHIYIYIHIMSCRILST